MTHGASEPSDRTLATLSGVVLALVVPITVQAHRVLLATWDHSAIRLLRSAALLDDAPFYPPPGSGWITASMYGPVSAAAYLPALAAPGPGAAVAIGQGLSTLFVIAGAAAVVLATSGRRPFVLSAATFAAFAVIGTVTLDLWALRYPTLTVHADAPTLGLGGLAIACHLRRDRPALAHTAALCAALAVWSKQVAIGVPAGLLLHALWADGWRAAGRTTLRLAGWGLVTSGLFVAAFGPLDAMRYHLLEVPGAQPWSWGGGLGALGRSLGLMAIENPVLIALGALLPILGRARSAAWTAPAAVAAVSIPLAALGRAKVAGDVNAYSHCLFYLLLAVAVGLRDAADRDAESDALPTRRLARWLLAVVPLVSLASLLATERDALRSPTHRVPYEAVARYVEDRPGRVYLPRLGLVTWYVEGRLDHQAPGLSDYRAAGLSIDRAHLLAGLPPEVDRMVFYDNPWVEQWRLVDRALDPRPLPPDPALPDCVVFEVRR